MTTDEKLEACEQALGYRFRDRALLRQCLTHASASNTRADSNERLEFLGDAVLGLTVCETLFSRFPQRAEGEMTRIKSALVSRETCTQISRRMELGKLLLLGKGLRSHGRVPSSILAAVFEALVGGVYLDGGWEAARELVQRSVEEPLRKIVDLDHRKNYKSLLQHESQKRHGATPIYRLLDEQGPDHSKCFKVAAVLDSRVHSPAWGSTKKEAEQRAAANAMAELAGDDVPHPCE